jgi:hypothetical protein
MSSDLIRQITITGFNVDGREVAMQDFTSSDHKVYPTAGSVAVYSVIMGQSNY